MTHSFTLVAIETLGAIGPNSLVFLKELGWRARRQSGDERAASVLLQRLSVAVQRGNAQLCRFWGGSGDDLLSFVISYYYNSICSLFYLFIYLLSIHIRNYNNNYCFYI